MTRSFCPFAVVDIGSNSVRLVIYDRIDAAPRPIYNEKDLCGLGLDLDKTGQLNPAGVTRALHILPRFKALCVEAGCYQEHPPAVALIATAAARDAAQGQVFLGQVAEIFNVAPTLLTGEVEAELSARGVISSFPLATGIMGDLGGGSVELAHLSKGRIKATSTLPLGPLRLPENMRKTPTLASKKIDKALKGVSWLSATAKSKQNTFYCVGGGWRNLAKLHIAESGYPLHIIDHYRIPGASACEFLDRIARTPVSKLQQIEKLNKRRAENLPFSAFLLLHILEQLKAFSPNSNRDQGWDIAFSAHGLREGLLATKAPEMSDSSPLLLACQKLVNYSIDGPALYHWLSPAIGPATPLYQKARSCSASTGKETERLQELAQAACILGNITRHEHPEYRALHAYWKVLRANITGIDHDERRFLAIALAARYGKSETSLQSRTGKTGIDLPPDMIKMAEALGYGLRFAFSLCAGYPTLLEQVSLEVKDGRLWLCQRSQGNLHIGETITRRLGGFAKSLDLTAMVNAP